MLDRFRTRMSSRYREVRERDRRWILQLKVQLLDRYLFALVTTFVLLNFADVVSTLVAISSGPSVFYEINPIASGLFQNGFAGFMLALLLKYLPLLPILFVFFMRDSPLRAVEVRSLKFGVLVLLAAADVYYAAVVANNLYNLFAASVI